MSQAKINCPNCGHNDWYYKGKHRACRPCQAQAVRRYRERQALGQRAERVSRPSRPLSASLSVATPAVAVRRRAQAYCKHRHALTGGNVRLQTDSVGRVERVCRACHRERQRARYGMPGTAQALGRLADLLREAQTDS